ncbi:hypothetical protein ABZ477_11765 [Microbacterium sp. NPDC019599]|uniref:hypothetical protein n=1 Tax=Microbacterium sp. NPDC019599 TaxID=3154690 RepID=UPI0033D43E1B
MRETAVPLAEVVLATADSGAGTDVPTLLLTALIGALGGAVGAWIGIWIDRRKAINNALVAKRLAIYEEMMPQANDVLCFFVCVGDWRRLSPQVVLARKRTLDRLRHVYGGLFSKEAERAYDHFMEQFFVTRTGPGEDAKLKADPAYLRRQWGPSWRRAWDSALAYRKPMEATESKSGRAGQRAAYRDLIAAFGRDIGAR